MNDVFVEQIISRTMTVKTRFKQMGIIFGILLLNTVVLFFGVLRAIFPVTLAVSCWFLWTYIGRFNVEFEYSYTNGDLDVDKILNRKVRQHVLSVRVRQFTILAPMTEEFAKEYNSNAIGAHFDASKGERSEGRWFARYTDDAGVDTLLIFNPNARLLTAMGKLIPSKIKGEIPQSEDGQ